MLYDFTRLLLEGGQAKAVDLRPEQLPPAWLRAEEKRLDRKTCRTPVDMGKPCCGDFVDISTQDCVAAHSFVDIGEHGRLH